VAFLPGDSIVAVTSEATQHVVFVRVADGTVLRAIATGQNTSHMLAVTAAADRIFTSNVGAGTVSELDVSAGQAARILRVPPQPEAITVTPSGDEVWVGSNSQGLVSVVKTSDGSVETAASGFGWPYRILITPDLRHVLIPDLRGESVRILDYRTRAERARLAFPGGAPQGVTLSGDGGTAFVSMSGQDRIAVIDMTTLTVTGYVPAGSRPDGVAWSPVDLSR
jgi:YVTN family beta-propeller protein